METLIILFFLSIQYLISTPIDTIEYLQPNWCLAVQFICRFAKAPDASRMDWSSFTKGYFLNRDTLVAVLLLIDASVPPQKIDLDCANWLGRNNVWFSVVLKIILSLSLGYGHNANRSPYHGISTFFLCASDTVDFCFHKVWQNEGKQRKEARWEHQALSTADQTKLPGTSPMDHDQQCHWFGQRWATPTYVSAKKLLGSIGTVSKPDVREGTR